MEGQVYLSEYEDYGNTLAELSRFLEDV